MSTERVSMEEHPDITELRARYDRAAETQVAQATSGLTLMAGLYVAMSPLIVGSRTTSSSLMINDLITGLAVTMLALGMASAYGRTHGIAWTVPLLGVWVIVAPWVINAVDTTAGMVLSNVIGGAVVVLLGLGALGATMMRRGG